MKVSALILLSFVATSVSGAPVPKELNKPSVEGRWQIVRYTINGNETSLKDLEWEIQGEKITAYRNGVPTSTTITLVPQKDVGDNAYDYTTPSGVVRPGTLEVTADRLKFVMSVSIGKERPNRIESATGLFYFEFKRAK